MKKLLMISLATLAMLHASQAGGQVNAPNQQVNVPMQSVNMPSNNAVQQRNVPIGFEHIQGADWLVTKLASLVNLSRVNEITRVYQVQGKYMIDTSNNGTYVHHQTQGWLQIPAAYMHIQGDPLLVAKIAPGLDPTFAQSIVSVYEVQNQLGESVRMMKDSSSNGYVHHKTKGWLEIPAAYMHIQGDPLLVAKIAQLRVPVDPSQIKNTYKSVSGMYVIDTMQGFFAYEMNKGWEPLPVNPDQIKNVYYASNGMKMIDTTQGLYGYDKTQGWQLMMTYATAAASAAPVVNSHSALVAPPPTAASAITNPGFVPPPPPPTAASAITPMIAPNPGYIAPPPPSLPSGFQHIQGDPLLIAKIAQTALPVNPAQIIKVYTGFSSGAHMISTTQGTYSLDSNNGWQPYPSAATAASH